MDNKVKSPPWMSPRRVFKRHQRHGCEIEWTQYSDGGGTLNCHTCGWGRSYA